MNRLLILLITAVLVLPTQIKAQNEQHSMSLNQAVEYALVHNQHILNAKLDIVAAESVVKQIISTGLPQINGNINLANNFELPTSFLPAEIVGGPPGESVPVQFGTAFSGNATVNIQQMLFNGDFFVGMEAAKTYKELSTKGNIKTEIDVIENVTKAYYGVLVNKLTLELMDKNFGRLDSLLRDTKALHKSGFAERIDVSRVQVQYNNIKVVKANTSKMLSIAESLLKFQMGMPVADEITLTDSLSPDTFNNIAPTAEFAYSNRIEYSILETQQSLALLDIKKTKFNYLPNLSLYANLGAVAGTGAGSNLFNVGNEWFTFGIVGVQMSIPIFDGFRKHRTVQQQQANLSKLKNSSELLKNGIDLEIKQSKTAYSNSVDYMNVQLENMKISEDVYNVTKKKYEAGVGSNIEVINADADYKVAQTNFFTALYSALLSKVSYDKALGNLN